jgi:hypothetical protein
MPNPYGVTLHPQSVRWAAAEGVHETVIAAVLLLHERSVDEIVPKLIATELEQVIKLVGRSPRLYPPGTLDVLKQRRTLLSPQPAPSNNRAKEEPGRTPASDHAGCRDKRIKEGHSLHHCYYRNRLETLTP